MNKKISNLLAFVCISMLCCTFASCNNSNNDEEIIPYKIVGTWVYSYTNGIEEITFNSDGTFIYIAQDSSAKIRCKGVYTLDDNSLSLNTTKYEIWNTESNEWGEPYDVSSFNNYEVTFNTAGNELIMKKLDDNQTFVYIKKK